MTGEGLFSGSTENVMRWVAGAGIVLGLASAAIMIVVLVRKPEWRTTAAAKWALLVGLLVLVLGRQRMALDKHALFLAQ